LSDPDDGTVEQVSKHSPQENMDEYFSSTNTYDLPSWETDNISDTSYQKYTSDSDNEKSDSASPISQTSQGYFC